MVWGVNWGVKRLDLLLFFLCNKDNFTHLFFHKLVVKMGVDPADKPLRAVAHPYVNDIGADILLAYCSKCMAQTVCCQLVRKQRRD